MTSHPKNGPRIPARGYKKKIAKLEAENGELKLALAEAERTIFFNGLLIAQLKADGLITDEQPEAFKEWSAARAIAEYREAQA